MTVARGTQLPVEVLASYTPEGRLTQLPVEVLASYDPNVRATQVVTEVLYSFVKLPIWKATENNVWSVGPWEDGDVPTAGEDVVFDDTSTFDCTLDENTAALSSLTIDVGYTGTFDADTFDVAVDGDFVADGTAVDMGSGDWTIGGDFDVASTTITKGTATITADGSGSVLWDVGAQAIGDVVFAHFGDVTLASGFTADSFTQTSGEVDVNGQTLSSVGNWTVTGGVWTDPVDATITVGGDFLVNGVDLIGSGNWSLDVTGTATITNSTVTNLQSVNPIVVIDGIDGGGNSANVTFEASASGSSQLTMRSSLRSARPMTPYI